MESARSATPLDFREAGDEMGHKFPSAYDRGVLGRRGVSDGPGGGTLERWAEVVVALASAGSAA